MIALRFDAAAVGVARVEVAEELGGDDARGRACCGWRPRWSPMIFSEWPLV